MRIDLEKILPGFFWTKDEGKWIAKDKGGHLILHFVIVRFLHRCLTLNPFLALLISSVLGFLYEWLWDCILVSFAYKLILRRDYSPHGASKRDLVANTAGGLLGMI